MDRSSSQHYNDDPEFSLPEGVDLVGIESSNRKSSSSASSSYQQRKIGGSKQQASKGPSWKGAFKLVVINLFVCALVLGYALLGSFVFLTLENQRAGGYYGSSSTSVQASTTGYPLHPDKNLTRAILSSLQGEQLQQLKRETVRNIWDITLSMNILYPDNWTKMTSEEVANFQQFLVDRVLTIVKNATIQEVPYPWNFPRAFLFALTTLTTIGYGGVGPKTSSGKLATMIYAIFGIPIMLWYLSNVGSLLAKIARFLCAKLCCCCCCREPRMESSRKNSDPYYKTKTSLIDTDDPHHHHHHQHSATTSVEDHSSMSHHHHHHNHHRVSIVLIMTLCVLVLLGYVCLGSYIVSRWEDWKFLDSFYFCFLTLTTISFGDSRSHGSSSSPSARGSDPFSQRTEWFCSFYILFGMALTSMFFNILHEEISNRLKRWKQPPSNGIDRSHSMENSTSMKDMNYVATGGGGTLAKRRPVENSYSVHFMNFSSPNATSASRNFTEETLLSNEMHSNSGGRGMSEHSEMSKSIYDDEEPPPPMMTEYGHPIPPPRDVYSSHPVFPR